MPPTPHQRDLAETQRRLEALQAAAWAAVTAGATAEECADYYVAGVEGGLAAAQTAAQGVALLDQYRNSNRRAG